MSFIQSPSLSEQDYPPFAAMKARLGFVPNLYRAQSARPDLIEAQLALIAAAGIKPSALERRQKEYIFLAVSARNLNTYCVTAHCEIVRVLQIEGPEPEQIAIDHTSARIPLADKALVNFAVKLNNEPGKMCQADIDTLRTFGFTDQQILEAVVITGLAQLANTTSFGLGTAPDVHNERVQSEMQQRQVRAAVDAR